MSRHLIISLLVLLILGVVGGTVILVISNLGNDENPEETINPGTLDPVDSNDTSTPKQPVNNVPSQNSAGLPISVDQYFSTNLDLTGGSRNLTDDYRNQYKEEDRNPDTLADFARSQQIITQLPQPVERNINLQPSDTASLMNNYLNTAGNLTVFSNQHQISEGLYQLFNNNNPSVVNALALSIKQHQARLLELRVPPSAISLHKLLLGYSELMATTYEQMAKYPQDPARGVTAMHQLEQIDKKFYPIIEREVIRLESLNEQLNG